MREWLRQPGVAGPLFGMFAAAASYAWALDDGYYPSAGHLLIVGLIGGSYAALIHRLSKTGRAPQEFIDSLYMGGIYLIAWCFRSWIRGDSILAFFAWFGAYAFVVLFLTAVRTAFSKKYNLPQA